MSQTDPRAVAKGIISGWYQSTEAAAGFTLGIAEHEWQRLEAIIAAVLADAERRGMERAAKMMCSYCNDPQWPRSAIVQGNAVHIGPITGSLFPCNAMQIHSALRAQAQAEQEG